MNLDDEFGDFSGADDEALTAALVAAERRAAAARSQNPTATATPATAVPPSTSQQRQQQQQQPSAPAPVVQQPAPQKSLRSGPSAIIVNSRQKGNPVLSAIKNVQWEYGDIVPDYVVGQTACVLYLSLKYHRLHPEYIYNRIKPLAHLYTLRILLVLVDIPPPPPPLVELTKTCLINNLTLILAFSPPEAARYLELYKSLEHTPPTLIREKQKSDYTSRMVDVVTKVRSVNKTDAVGIVGTFGSVRGAVNAKVEELVLVQGWGERKAGRWKEAVEGGFRVGGSRLAAATGDVGGSSERAGAARAETEKERRGVAQKLGIGPANVPDVGMRDAVYAGQVGFDDEDERAFLEAEGEAERERVLKEKQGEAGAGEEGASGSGGAEGNNQAGGEKSGGHDGIMKALEKLRA